MALTPGARLNLGPGDWRDENYELQHEPVAGTVARSFRAPWPVVLLEDDAGGTRYIHVRLGAITDATAQEDP